MILVYYLWETTIRIIVDMVTTRGFQYIEEVKQVATGNSQSECSCCTYEDSYIDH